jgi:hypothetical protein
LAIASVLSASLHQEENEEASGTEYLTPEKKSF